ncbi:hypothetical protein BZG36_00159 [Bifiguratus adelaidae]|uniref:Serine/threonine-protein kinase RIO1 n=1 Tax=Bifiguratus adelaidae TaxID=1938954 RepID=A0A261Y8K1_9FUNG|nr:hypothetical protein BZG36_00159 [Bifiguratus adelaidae]
MAETDSAAMDKAFEEEYGDDDYEYDSYEDLVDDELNDADTWDSAKGDFTKQYNKLKSQVEGPSENGRAAPASNFRHKAAVEQIAKPTAAQQKQLLAGQLEAYAKYASRIHLDAPFETSGGPADLGSGSRKAKGERQSTKDKSDRATSEQVLDPRTRIILFKMLNSGVIYEINGCISTGKEANVYHAVTEDGQHRAVKVYKTSILTFKDRDRYVTGEYRFRHGYSKSNPRKMVKLWAEKEMRNLKRLHSAGIPCPEPLLLRMHVLLMDFLGDKSGWAYPRLKDATIDASRYPDLYFQLVKNMRTMYQVCRLVHADLSEYNILYHSRTLYIIDVSQSVEHDHPSAFEFLRKDVTNVTDYFSKKGVNVMSLKQLFAFVTDEGFTNEETAVEAELEKIRAEIEHRKESAEEKKQVEIEDAIFKQEYIPRKLDQVYDVERDTARIARGEGEDLIYSKLLNLSIKDVVTDDDTDDVGDDADSSDANSSSPKAEEEDHHEGESDGDSESEIEDDHVQKGKRFEDKESKKLRKQAAKEEAREKRKNKIPKAEKKKKIKATSAKKKK